jgi:large subunit ribosomal protein L15
MELNSLSPQEGSVKTRKRIGRGTGSGRGGTSTRGHKGDKARSGFKEKRAHEGGQTPMQRRLPKRGFKNINHVEFNIITLSDLEKMFKKQEGTRTDGMEIDLTVGTTDKVKVLSNGKLTSPVRIKVHAISASAQAAIEAAGGSVQLV